MNLPVIFSKVLSAGRRVAGNGLLFAKAHAPELLVGTGIAGYGATVYSACKATAKAHDIMDDRDDAVEGIAKSNLLRSEQDEAIAMTEKRPSGRSSRLIFQLRQWAWRPRRWFSADSAC